MSVLGFTHAASGVSAWLAVTTLAGDRIPGGPLPATQVGLGVIVCAGAGLLPDLDHPQASVARTFGPVSAAASRLVNVVAGGHRQATHSIAAAVLAGLGAQAAAWAGGWAVWIVVFVLAGLGFRVLNLVPPGCPAGARHFVALAQAAAVVWVAAAVGVHAWAWLGLCVFIGCVAHLVGDSLTAGGVPWCYPWKHRFSLPVIGHTGNWVETRIAAPLIIAAGVGCALWRAWPG